MQGNKLTMKLEIRVCECCLYGELGWTEIPYHKHRLESSRDF